MRSDFVLPENFADQNDEDECNITEALAVDSTRALWQLITFKPLTMEIPYLLR